MKKRLLACVVAAATAASIGLSVPATAAVTLRADGTGSVGREDVLRAVGWTNDRLQTSAAELDLVAETVTVATASWECVQESTGAVTVQERRTTTTARADLLAAVQRSSVTGAVTGFELQGFAEDAVSVAVVEGPELDACPADGGSNATENANKNENANEAGAWSRVPRSTERAQAHEGPALELVHEGVAHRVPTERDTAA
ncbi:hypothetical protein [uncultured Kocuria sp.]|uniref:hypothetical protein n=1 Tax=uncultured Kocuria sp. TaxID=259305 RepID=UPI002603C0AF|nr:hypothetical protein [uncultured Kocuria sp.]